MSKRLGIALVFVIGLAFVVFLYFRNGSSLKNILGDKRITEGVIEYEVSYPKFDPSNMLISGMPDKAYLRFKNNDMSNDMSGMMGLINISFISNHSNKSVIQALTLLNKKYVSDVNNGALEKMNGSYIESIQPGTHTKNIAGFKCKEAIVKLKAGQTIHIFYTKDIGIKDPNWSNPYHGIDGVLMDFQVEKYGIIMAIKAKTVRAEDINDSVFQVDTNDHKKIPLSELEKMLDELNPSSE